VKILVTGANGFIGSNIVKKLSLEHEVYSIYKDYNSIFDLSPDIIIHCGWFGGNSYLDINNMNQFYENIDKGIQLLEIIKKIPKKVKFIGFGSFAEFGSIENTVDENTQESPSDLYGLSKYAFKMYSEMICKQNDIDWMWIRPCYIYGPGDASTRLIPTIINKFLNNQEVILDGCNKTIDYIYIDDFIEMIYRLIKKDGVTGVYNLCSGKKYNLKEIINQVYFFTNSKSNIIFDNTINRNSSKYICGDNKKIVNLINYSPKIDLENGLIKTINYYK
jgi:nucleoside-diphosphate-sugar epimerase